MNYIEVVCTLHDAVTDDVAVALLSELGFESFEESGSTVKAYIREELFDAAALSATAEEYAHILASVASRHIRQENWNQVWESNFPMAVVAERCAIHAPFHTDVPELEYRIVIMPQMSFGTGHHETTALMVELMLDANIGGKTVLDMGCGTGILSILAAMKGARAITAVDIDEWAYRNTAENCVRNNTGGIEILMGDSSLLTGKNFDIVLANINRNILLADIGAYAACIPASGLLQVSGFYTADLCDIRTEARRHGLSYVRHLTRKDWVAAQFVK
jgi:ribosomal protein L11 methyltransferase